MKKILPLLLLSVLLAACAAPAARGSEGAGEAPAPVGRAGPFWSIVEPVGPSLPAATATSSPLPAPSLTPTRTPFPPATHTPTPPGTASGNLDVARARFAANRAAVLEASERWNAPRLALPDLQTLPPFNLHLVHDGASGKSFIRFSNSIWNSGLGPLELRGRPAPGGGSILVTQRVFLQTGALFEERRVGEFIFHPYHNHWHLEDFALYEVWSLDEDGSLLEPVTAGGKVSYCVTDVSRGEPPLGRQGLMASKTYYNCLGDLQGLSRGWVDTYEFNIQGQWVEITGLQNGTYALASTVDPDDRVREQVEDNNVAFIYFELDGKRLRKVSRPGG